MNTAWNSEELAKTQLNIDMEKNSLTRVKRRLEIINCLAITNDLLCSVKFTIDKVKLNI